LTSIIKYIHHAFIPTRLTAVMDIGTPTQHTRIIGLPLSILFCLKKSALGNAVDGVLVVHELTSITQITYPCLLLMKDVQNRVFYG